MTWRQLEKVLKFENNLKDLNNVEEKKSLWLVHKVSRRGITGKINYLIRIELFMWCLVNTEAHGFIKAN